MNIKVSNILKHPTFKEAKVLAGKNGLHRKINRVSVFDCAVPDDLVEQKIIDDGDFFISGLLQFKDDYEGLKHFIHILCYLNSSGLCVMSNDYGSVLTDEILKLCDDKRFPVIQLDENIPYAYVMDTVNRFLAMENLNAINELKIDKILSSNLSEKEKVELLHSINSNMERYLQVIYIKGEAKSLFFADELNVEYLNMPTDIFINSKRRKLIIASNNSKAKLIQHINTIRTNIDEHIENPVMGISRIHDMKMVDRCLNEASLALSAAKTLGINIKEYNPLSSSQLLISLQDSKELEEFYTAFLEKLKTIASGDALEETIRTIEIYVLNKGDFKKTGKILNQHENTIRYRINKVRDALEMENDLISFHEVISIATKANLLLKS